MERKEFLKICGGACLGIVGMAAVLQSCGSTHYVQGIETNKQLQINKSDFVKVKNEKIIYRKLIVVKSASFDFPIIVYRLNETNYSALLLRCTHQGNELNVNGDILTCSAHGSEFGNKGEVIQGPAEQKLKSFPVTIDENYIYLQIQ